MIPEKVTTIEIVPVLARASRSLKMAFPSPAQREKEGVGLLSNQLRKLNL